MSKTRALRVLLIGPPGGGKGTVGKYMAKDFGFHIVSTGDLLRKEIEQGTELGKSVAGVMKSGGLVSNNIMLSLLQKEFDSLGPNKSWLLDGFPRTLQQCVLLDSLLQSRLSQQMDCVFHLDVPFDVILPRVAGRLVHAASGRTYNEHFSPPRVANTDDVTGEPLMRRPDDEPETVMRRLNAFADATRPILEHYKHVLGPRMYNIQCQTSPEGYTKIKPILENMLATKKQ